ncbi:SDR family NAD(P)-dependent oxidoreductase [Paenibacillus sp. HW567]|uniref:SDR family NAD(P)-dependent oxidoreductase n=1 Tax=Paenibacillus sp. HW567 TaxID=1034769 RepID=UPI000377C6F3|nr:SDR family oxidoreductase [Paenibacillus sp. HW567]
MEENRKIALVTGASRGIGRDTALALARTGKDLVITYKSEKDKAAAVVSEIEEAGGKAVALQLDAADNASFVDFTASLTALLTQKWNKTQLDYLIHNAGTGAMNGFLDTTEEQFDEMINVHLKSVFFLTQKLSPLLADQGGIVNISTGLTRFTTPGASIYAAAKGAVEILTKYMAKELGPRGIRVNVVAPGPVDTDFGGGHGDNQGFRAFIASQTTLGRIAVPGDIGGVIASLCSPEMAWVTAQRIEVSGGMLL